MGSFMMFMIVGIMIGLSFIGIVLFSIDYICRVEEVAQRKAKKGLISSGVIFITMGILMFFVWTAETSSPEKSPTKETMPEIDLRPSVKRLKENYVIAISKEYLNRGSEMLMNKDFEAFKQLTATGVVGLTKAGVEVYVVHIHPNGTAEVRAKGSTDILWTDYKAIQEL